MRVLAESRENRSHPTIIQMWVFNPSRVAVHRCFCQWQSVGCRFFTKRRILVSTPKPVEKPVVELYPYRKLRDIAKKSYLPLSHVTKALCTRNGKFFYLRVIEWSVCEL